MNPLSPADVLATLQWRYAVHTFDHSRPIPADVWNALEQALVLAPSSFGLQPWKFLVVDDPVLRQQLRAASWNQPQVTTAARYVVFLGRRTLTEADVDRHLQRQAEVRGQALESLGGYRKSIVGLLHRGWTARDLGAWNARQVYIALGQFTTAAALLGVDTSPLEGIDVAAYDRLLGLEGGDHTTLVACAAGYRCATDKYAGLPKVRFPAEQVIERR
jgi:nitroreductase